jgi:hypothetical protein
MASSGILRRVTLVRTDVSEERSAPIFRVTRIGELETTLAVTRNRSFVLRVYSVSHCTLSASIPCHPIPSLPPPSGSMNLVSVMEETVSGIRYPI